jgi:hypothetical protein
LAVTKLPGGTAWSYELKFDAYRAIGLKATGKVRLFSRNGKDFFLAGLPRSGLRLKRSPTNGVYRAEITAGWKRGAPLN